MAISQGDHMHMGGVCIELAILEIAGVLSKHNSEVGVELAEQMRVITELIRLVEEDRRSRFELIMC